MNDDPEHALNNSLSAGDGYQTQSQTPPLNTAGLTARPLRLTAGWAGRNLIRTAVTSAIVAMAIAGFGVVGAVGEASAKPKEREHARYCSEMRKQQRFQLKMIGTYDNEAAHAASEAEKSQKRELANDMSDRYARTTDTMESAGC